MNCPDHGEVDGDTCWDCPISPYSKVGSLTTCCGHRKDDHRGDGCQAAVTFGDPPQGAGRCACRYMGEAENQEAWPRPTTVDRLDPDERAHVEKVRGWVQELARMHVEDGEELPTRLALAMIDAGKLVRIFDKHVPAPKEGSGT